MKQYKSMKPFFAILGMLLRKNVWIIIYLFTDYNKF